MKRREFLSGAAVLGASALVGCQQDRSVVGTYAAGETINWRMVTTWPMNFPGLGTGANTLARLIGEMSGGRIRVQVYGAGELVPAFEVFDAVSRGTAEMGHGAAYYWKGKSESVQFFAAVPFGMNGQELSGWLYHGGGLELYRELYAPFNLVPAPAGNTGVQMGGWFNKEIRSVADLRGLRMRIPGLGGDVLRRAGGTPVNLPGSEIFTALQSGAIDATEWVGPYNDLAFGLHRAARYYYYPGWQEPCASLEALVNKQAFDALPEDLRSIVLNACRVTDQDMLAEYTARNNQALDQLVNEHRVELRQFPDDVLHRIRELSQEVLAEVGSRDELAQRIYRSYTRFHEQVRAYHRISEKSYYLARDL
ncbi:MAG: TRAP transporter substrate-binding protein [Xanthomonadaceae bacterium]|nr:TRAP transporter substrate-binding protein [Xanthomonadaceae bacterium]